MRFYCTLLLFLPYAVAENLIVTLLEFASNNTEEALQCNSWTIGGDFVKWDTGNAVCSSREQMIYIVPTNDSTVSATLKGKIEFQWETKKETAKATFAVDLSEKKKENSPQTVEYSSDIVITEEITTTAATTTASRSTSTAVSSESTTSETSKTTTTPTVPTTTATVGKPSNVTMTIHFVLPKEQKKEEEKKKEGNHAVVVAVIEALIIIALIIAFCYKTVIEPRKRRIQQAFGDPTFSHSSPYSAYYDNQDGAGRGVNIDRNPAGRMQSEAPVVRQPEMRMESLGASRLPQTSDPFANVPPLVPIDISAPSQVRPPAPTQSRGLDSAWNDPFA